MTLANYGAMLRRVAGGGDPAALVAPAELLAMLAIEVDRPEWAFLKGERLGGGYVAEGAHAADRSCCGVVNPVGSNVLCVIKEIHAVSPTYALTLSLMTALLVAAYDDDGIEFQRDTRAALYNTTAYYPAVHIISDEAPVPGGVITRLYPTMTDATARFDYHYFTPYVLQPGSCLVLAPTADNNSLEAAFVWTESPLTPEEMQGAVRSQ